MNGDLYCKRTRAGDRRGNARRFFPDYAGSIFSINQGSVIGGYGSKALSERDFRDLWRAVEAHRQFHRADSTIDVELCWPKAEETF